MEITIETIFTIIILGLVTIGVFFFVLSNQYIKGLFKLSIDKINFKSWSVGIFLLIIILILGYFALVYKAEWNDQIRLDFLDILIIPFSILLATLFINNRFEKLKYENQIRLNEKRIFQENFFNFKANLLKDIIKIGSKLDSLITSLELQPSLFNENLKEYIKESSQLSSKLKQVSYTLEPHEDRGYEYLEYSIMEFNEHLFSSKTHDSFIKISKTNLNNIKNTYALLVQKSTEYLKSSNNY